jgi:hypothetical protein
MKEALSEDSNLKTNTGFALKLIGGVIFCVYSGAMIMASINALELDLERIKHEVELNSEFRIKWPREGELPADVMQNLNIELINKRLVKYENLIDEMRYGGAK